MRPLLQQAVTAPPAPVPLGGDPGAVYRALRDQREVLGSQRNNVERRRDDLQQEYDQMSASNPGRDGIASRLKALDAHLQELDAQIAKSDASVATAAGVPGATDIPPRPPRQGPPEEAFVLGGLFIVVVLLPMSIAFARRIWRRSAKAVVTLPPQVAEHMESLERGVEAIALEVERIGEGQRFLTSAMAERIEARPRPDRAGEPQPAYLRPGEQTDQRR